MHLSDELIATSKRLCLQADEIRAFSKILIYESKAAVARAERVFEYQVKRQEKSNLKPQP